MTNVKRTAAIVQVISDTVSSHPYEANYKEATALLLCDMALSLSVIADALEEKGAME